MDTLFGSNETHSIIDRWSNQGFQFARNIPFGLLQVSGGPCGVLASVQGFIIKNLFFDNSFSIDKIGKSDVESALVSALTEILLNSALENSQITLVIVDRAKIRFPDTESHSFDGSAFLCNAEPLNEKDLTDSIRAHLAGYTSSSGLLAFLFSVILSRTPAQIKKDMDDPSDHLIKRFGYSSQELVNLMLTGKAVSNVFDGEKSLSEGTDSEGEKLKGVTKRSPIGFLSYLECVGYVKVGENLKTPLFPIWVINSQSHYTLIFSPEKRLVRISEEEKTRRRFLSIFYEFDQFETGFTSMSVLPKLLEKMPLHSIQTSFVLSELCTQAEGDTLLFNDLYSAIQKSFGRIWTCQDCTTINQVDNAICEACNNTFKSLPVEIVIEEDEELSRAEMMHYNGMNHLETKNGRFYKFRIILTKNDSFPTKEETIENVLKTKWPGCNLQFQNGEESNLKI